MKEITCTEIFFLQFFDSAILIVLSLLYVARSSAIRKQQTRISACIDEVAGWMRSNRLQLNSSKTEILWILCKSSTTPTVTDPAFESALTTWFRLQSFEISEFSLILTYRCGPTSHDRCRPVFRSSVSSVQFAVQCPDPWSSRWLHFLFLVVWTTEIRHLQASPTLSSAAPVCYECSSSTRLLVV